MKIFAKLRGVGQLTQAAPIQAAISPGDARSNSGKVHKSLASYQSFRLPAASFQVPSLQSASITRERKAGSWELETGNVKD